MAEQFTQLESLKAWLSVSSNTSDAMLTGLIGQVTRFLLSYLSIDSFLYRTVTISLDGDGGNRIMLPDSPVWAVTSLMIDGITVPVVEGTNMTGYVLERSTGVPPAAYQTLGLNGYRFAKGVQNISITFTTGYAVLNEPMAMSSTGTAVQAPFGSFARDEGVTVNGAAFTKVAAAPATGQYTVDATGKYAFNAADTGTALVSYSYVPSDIEQACIEMVGERFRYRDRIGQRSKTLGGQETTAYNLADMPAYVKTMLNQHKRVFKP